jgi:hypothetical protein
MGTGRAAMAFASTGFTICGASSGGAGASGALARAVAASLKRWTCDVQRRRVGGVQRRGGGTLRNLPRWLV